MAGAEASDKGGIVALLDVEEISRGQRFISKGGVHQGRLDY